MIITKTLILYGYICPNKACGARMEPDNDDYDHYNFCQYCGTKLSEDDIPDRNIDNA